MKPPLSLVASLVLLGCDVSVSLTPCGETETQVHFSPRIGGGGEVRVQLVGDRLSQECTAALTSGTVKCRGSGPVPELLIEESALHSVFVTGEAYRKLAVSVELDGASVVDELVTFEPALDACSGDTISTATATVAVAHDQGVGGVGGLGGLGGAGAHE